MSDNDLFDDFLKMPSMSGASYLSYNDLYSTKKADLEALANKYGLSNSGTKPILVNRINDYLLDNSLQSIKKSNLELLADKYGLSKQGTKPVLIKTIYDYLISIRNGSKIVNTKNHGVSETKTNNDISYDDFLKSISFYISLYDLTNLKKSELETLMNKYKLPMIGNETVWVYKIHDYLLYNVLCNLKKDKLESLANKYNLPIKGTKTSLAKIITDYLKSIRDSH